MSLGLHLLEIDDDGIVDRASLSDFRSARLTYGASSAVADLLEPISDEGEEEKG